MAKRVISALEQNELDIVAKLDEIDEFLKDIRATYLKAEAEQYAKDLKVAVDELLKLRIYPPLLVEVAQ